MTDIDRNGGLLQWQWRGYSRKHCDRTNLLIHIIAVPAFVAGLLAMITLSLHAQWVGVLVAGGVCVVAFALQGIGHKREQSAPEPFAGAGDFVARILAEQLITFPRFVLSGQWAKQFAAGSN